LGREMATMVEKMSETWKAALAGVFVGVLLTIISIFASWYFFMEGSKQLVKETERLEDLNTMMLLGMKNMGWIKLELDKKGKIVVWKPIVGTINAVLPPIKASIKGTVGLPPDSSKKPEKLKK
jgi:hypothetical protein